MHVTLYMAMTVNGFIATENDDAPWSTPIWESYYAMVKQFGNIVVGRRTYEFMAGADEFAKIGNPFAVVVTNKPIPESESIVAAPSPEEALRLMQEHNHINALVGGGSTLNASFLKTGLVDEIILDIEPMLFGKGIPLFATSAFETQLKLQNTKKISDDIVQLHYHVEKK